MSPRKFFDDDDHKQQSKTGIMINGPKPTPLKLKQESHTVHNHKHHHQKMRKPIIIYLHSPEVIHTKPHDFMALVQKLTGHSVASKDQEQEYEIQESSDLIDNEFSNDFGVKHERNNSTMKSKSPMMFDAPLNRYISDIPLFTPNTSDYFFSPQQFLKLSHVVSSSPNMSNSLSPGSLVELMKEVHEY